MRQISLIKSTVCALIFPLYALISTIIFIAQIIMNPLFAARRNHPIYKTRLEELSIFERKEAKSITDKNKHNTDLLQQELQKRIIFVREYIDSLSINELQSIANPLKRFDDVMKFSAFKADKRAQNQGIEFEEIFKLIEQKIYSLKRGSKSFDQLFLYALNKQALLDYKSLNPNGISFFFHVLQSDLEDTLFCKKIDSTVSEDKKIIENLIELFGFAWPTCWIWSGTIIKNNRKKAIDIFKNDILNGKKVTNDDLLKTYVYFQNQIALVNNINNERKSISPGSGEAIKNLNLACDILEKEIFNIDNRSLYESINFNADIKPKIQFLQEIFFQSATTKIDSEMRNSIESRIIQYTLDHLRKWQKKADPSDYFDTLNTKLSIADYFKKELSIEQKKSINHEPIPHD